MFSLASIRDQTRENVCLRKREMPHACVKYTPAVEQADPDFDKHLQTVIEATKQYIQDSVESEGLNRAVRDAHAKGYGLARAKVEILGGLAPEYAQGVYALPG